MNKLEDTEHQAIRTAVPETGQNKGTCACPAHCLERVSSHSAGWTAGRVWASGPTLRKWS